MVIRVNVLTGESPDIKSPDLHSLKKTRAPYQWKANWFYQVNSVAGWVETEPSGKARGEKANYNGVPILQKSF